MQDKLNKFLFGAKESCKLSSLFEANVYEAFPDS